MWILGQGEAHNFRVIMFLAKHYQFAEGFHSQKIYMYTAITHPVLGGLVAMVTEERSAMAAATSAPSTGLERPSTKEGAESTSSIVDSASPGGDERGVANSSSRLNFSFVMHLLL